MVGDILEPIASQGGPGQAHPKAEPRWHMALAIVAVAVLRLALPSQLRISGSPWLISAFTLVLLAAVIMADPGRIDRQSTVVRVLTDALIGFISLANAWSAVKLVAYILGSGQFDNAAILLRSGGIIWFINVIAFALWYWDLDRGGAAVRAGPSAGKPAFVFQEMSNPEYMDAGWSPRFIDYLHLSFTTATAFSPTDVSAIRPWAKLLMMGEEAISLLVGLLVI